MDIKHLKTYLSEHPDKIKYVLEELGFHHVRHHDGGLGADNYLTCANFDGNNQTAITIYLSESLLTINYTREMCSNKVNCDFVDLVCWSRKDKTFFENVKWLADLSGVDYYKDFDSDVYESLKILRTLKQLLNKDGNTQDDDNTPIQLKDECILSYYEKSLSQMFYDDNISYETQFEFEIGYDQFSNRITIPIRDEIGNLVGIKGRMFERNPDNDAYKYVYLERCPRGKILFGYFKSSKYIQESDTTYILEAEKGFFQAWSYGFKNSVATGGTTISRIQIEKLSRLNKKLIFCFDKDFTIEKIQHLRNNFLPQIPFYSIIDKENILSEKQSPSDDLKKFEYLLKNHVYEIEKEENL